MIVTDYLENDFLLLRKSSQQARISRVRYLTEAPLAQLVAHELNAETIDEWIKWLKTHDTNKDTARSSFKQELKLLVTILNWYRENRDPHFVLPILRRHRRHCEISRKPARPPDYFIRPEQVRLWLQQLGEHSDPVYGHLARFMILTGCRLGEACGLLWDAVSDDYVTIRITRTLAWDYKTKAPYLSGDVKSKASRRIIQLPPSLTEILRERSYLGAKAVFTNRKGDYLKDNAVRDNFNRAFIYLGLPWRGTHICRHTSATLALLAQQDITIVQALLGHSSIRQTQEYAKVVALEGNEAPRATEDLLGI